MLAEDNLQRLEPAGADRACALPLQVVDAGVAAAEKLGLSWQRMVSRAYHDSLFMAKASA